MKSDVRSDVPNFWRIRWREQLRCTTGIYLERWYLETPFGSIRLHHWLHGDDARHHHSHPWHFITIVLLGSYVDRTATGEDRLHIGSVRFRKAEHEHYVDLDSKSCWTLLLTGPRIRRWGFRVNRKFVKANKYFLINREHQCR